MVEIRYVPQNAPRRVQRFLYKLHNKIVTIMLQLFRKLVKRKSVNCNKQGLFVTKYVLTKSAFLSILSVGQIKKQSCRAYLYNTAKRKRGKKNMAKITTEERKHLVTKSTVSYRVTVRTFSMKTGEQGEMTVNVSGDFANDIALLSYVAGRYTTLETAVVPVALSDIEKIEKRFAMFDATFFRQGKILSDSDKTAGLMIRTLTLTTVKAVCADFDTRTFTEEKINVVGEYDSAKSVIDWINRDGGKKVYAVADSEYMEKCDVKIGIELAVFFENAFCLTE